MPASRMYMSERRCETADAKKTASVMHKHAKAVFVVTRSRFELLLLP